jgi:hypothetical protein
VRKPLTVLAATVAGLTALTTPNAQAAVPPANTALLVTGDQVVTTTLGDGRTTATILPATESGLGRVRVHLGLGKKTYELPAAALPYLGRGLDWSLFDVDAVRHAQQSSKIAVRSEGKEQRLDVNQAKEFGAKLVRRFLDDRARGSFTEFRPAMSLPDAAPPAKLQPLSVMRTLTVAANGPDGKPDNGDTAIVYNADNGDLVDPNEFAQPFYQGEAKFSVPEGHYSVLGLFFETDVDGTVTGVRYSAQPEVNVFADTTTKVHAQQATSKVTWVTPRPALAQDGGFLLRRAARTGVPLEVDVAVGPGVPVWVSPVSRPVVTGKLQSYPYNRLSSPPGPGTPYEYQLQQATTNGTIPQQRYVVKPASLATIDANYYSELNSVGVRQRAGMFSFETSQARYGHQIILPFRQTEYVSADPSISWYGGLAKYVSLAFGGWFGGMYDTGRGYQPGQSLREDWNRFPLHPAGQEQFNLDKAPWPVVPAATRQGDNVRFQLYPFSDSTPGHTGMGYYGEQRDKITGAYAITENGVRIAGGELGMSGMEFQTGVTLGASPSTVGLTLDAGREGPMYLQSTASHTEWTWRSSHTADTTLPNALACEIRKFDAPDRNCAVEPLMTLGYAVGGMAVTGTVPNGPQTLDLTVGHLQTAQTSAITGASVQFSIDDGASWQDASVSAQGNGGYRAAFTAEAPNFRGAYVSLRVSATDANGGQISETVTRAYKIFQ